MYFEINGMTGCFYAKNESNLEKAKKLINEGRQNIVDDWGQMQNGEYFHSWVIKAIAPYAQYISQGQMNADTDQMLSLIPEMGIRTTYASEQKIAL